MAMLYTHSIEIPPQNMMVVFKMRDSYLAQDILQFVMYCINGKPRSSLFMFTCTSYVHTHIYIADMRTKKVSECAIISEQSFFFS